MKLGIPDAASEQKLKSDNFICRVSFTDFLKSAKHEGETLHVYWLKPVSSRRVSRCKSFPAVSFRP